MSVSLLFNIIGWLCLSCSLSAQGKPKTNLRSFLNSTKTEQNLTQGAGIYVEGGNSELPDAVRYSHRKFRGGVAFATDGTEVAIEGRYDRESRRIQVLYLNKVVNLDGVFFPYVRIGAETLAYVNFASEGSELSQGYVLLRIGTSADRFRGYVVYEFVQPGTASVDRGIVPSRTEKTRIDSSYLLGGLADTPVELPRREKWLLPLLDSCSLGIMKELPLRYRADDFKVLEAIVIQLNIDCGG